MPSDAPKRRLPRFSLITLIVAVNVAGVMVWVNLRVRTVTRILQETYEAGLLTITVSKIKSQQGWPFMHGETLRYSWQDVAGPSRKRVTDRASETTGVIPTRWYPTALICNLTIGVMLASLSALLTEFLVRKLRKAKRHDR